MEDRISLYPGRVKLVPVEGQENTYDMERADEPTQEGTPLSKATLLTDETETALFGSAADRTVNDAFAGIATQLRLIMDDMASITLTLTDGAGHALPEVLVQGILNESGQAVYSDTSGVASGYIAEGSQTIKITGYADIADYSETLEVVKGSTITKTLSLTTLNFLKLTSSKSLKFSGNVETVDVNPVGGGGGGGSGAYNLNYRHQGAGGGGGGGGYSVIETGVAVTANTTYSFVVGTGGAANTNGGSSSAMGVTANGGNAGNSATAYAAGTGGSGNGAGGNGVTCNDNDSRTGNDGLPGTASTQSAFKSFAETEGAGGGGGGGGGSNGGSMSGGAGGSPGGAAGSGRKTSGAVDAANGSSGGGGGGAGICEDDEDSGWFGWTLSPGKGGSGSVRIRMHLKSAS